jgi:hypothetical protein
MITIAMIIMGSRFESASKDVIGYLLVLESTIMKCSKQERGSRESVGKAGQFPF